MTSGGKQVKWRRVFDHYADRIESGQLRPGDRLPTYPEMERLHSISHVTALSVVRRLKDAHYVRTTTAGIVVDLSGPNRLYQLLCDTLNALDAAGQQLQVEEFGGLACIAGRDGGACWNPKTERWEAPRN